MQEQRSNGPVLSARLRASRMNGRKGGLATAKKHGAQFLEERASKAGSACRDKYGSQFYGFIRRKFSIPSAVPSNRAKAIREIISVKAHSRKVPSSVAMANRLGMQLLAREL